MRDIIFVIIGLTLALWYLGKAIQSPNEYSKNIIVEATFAEVEDIKGVGQFNMDIEYTIESTLYLRKRRSLVPFIHIIDTLKQTKPTLMGKVKTD